MRKSLMFAGLVLALIVGEFASGFTCAQAAPATWSLQRASLGFDAKAGIESVDGVETSRFLPGVYGSYSLASNLSLAATLERDFPAKYTLASAGARVRVLDTERGDIAGGLNVAFYADEGAAKIEKPTSYTISLHGAWDAVRPKNGQTTVWLIGSVANDPQNHITTYRAGLRYQLVGGTPIREPEPLP